MKKIKIFLVIYSILFVLAVVNLIKMIVIYSQTENTTTLYSATVKKSPVTSMGGDGIYARIKTEENISEFVLLPYVNEKINIDDVTDLQSGQKIFFRIRNSEVKRMNKADFINIVSLKTEEKDIFSLDEYNVYVRKVACPELIEGLAVALFTSAVSIFCIHLIRLRKAGKSLNLPHFHHLKRRKTTKD